MDDPALLTVREVAKKLRVEIVTKLVLILVMQRYCLRLDPPIRLVEPESTTKKMKERVDATSYVHQQ